MHSHQHQALYDERNKVRGKSKVLQKQNDKLEALVSMFKAKNEKLLTTHRDKAQKQIALRKKLVEDYQSELTEYQTKLQYQSKQTITVFKENQM